MNTPATALRDKAQATRRESSLFGPTPKPRPSAVSNKPSGETPTPRPSVRHKSMVNPLGSSTTSVGTNTTTGETPMRFARSIAPPRDREPITRPRSSLGTPTPANVNARTTVPAAAPAPGRRSALGTSDTGSVRKATEKENRPLSAASNAPETRTARRSWLEPA